MISTLTSNPSLDLTYELSAPLARAKPADLDRDAVQVQDTIDTKKRLKGE